MGNNILTFADQSAIEDQAAAWLIKLDGEEPLSKVALTYAGIDIVSDLASIVWLSDS